MFNDILLDLLRIVGIAFLGFIFIAIVSETVNYIKLQRAKSHIYKELERITLKAYKSKIIEDIKNERVEK